MVNPRWKSRSAVRVLLVSLGIAVAVSAVSAMFIERGSRSVSRRYINDATQRAATQFQDMRSGVEASLGMVRDWGSAGLIDPARVEKAKELLFPFFAKNNMLSGISVADAKGKGFFLLPDGSVHLPQRENLYNAVDRPWFAPALETEESHWTGIYRFYTLQELGITASIAWTDGSGATKAVAAFDILLDDFFEKVQQMAPTPASRAFVFLPDGQLYVPGTESEKSEFRSVDLVKDEQAKLGLALWDDGFLWSDGQKWKDDGLPELKVVQTRIKGEAWWCGFVPLEKSRRMVWMGVLVPEADIVVAVARRRWIVMAIGLVSFLALAGFYGFLMSRGGSADPLDVDIDAGQVRALVAKGESRSVEFKSTMRMNLHAKKPGKEIELAWLKGVAGFLNTDGGTLLLGVTDDGEITGIEQDVFENEDKCRLHFKNLVATHIGADLSKHIRFRLVAMDGRTVGVVQCSRASKPVYLRNGNKEAFYIRNGPSSDELPASKMVGYIEEHWK